MPRKKINFTPERFYKFKLIIGSGQILYRTVFSTSQEFAEERIRAQLLAQDMGHVYALHFIESYPHDHMDIFTGNTPVVQFPAKPDSPVQD